MLMKILSKYEKRSDAMKTDDREATQQNFALNVPELEGGNKNDKCGSEIISVISGLTG